MFDLEKAITEWRRQMEAAGIKSPAALEELENHLRDDIRRLAGSGLPETEAFQAAARELGKGAELKEEFAKVDSATGLSRGQTMAINLLGIWLILTGVDGLVNFLVRSISIGIPYSSWSIFNLFQIAVSISVGIGLFQRRNFWRIFGLILCGWRCLGNLSVLAYLIIYGVPLTAFHGTVQVRLLGFLVPFEVAYVIRFIGLFMCLLGLGLLGRQNVRNSFLGGDSGWEAQTPVASWEWRAKRWLVWFLRIGLASLTLIAVRIFGNGGMYVSERILGLEAVALVILSVCAGRSRLMQRLFSERKIQTAPMTIKLIGAVSCVGWAAAFGYYLRLHPDLEFSEAFAITLWAAMPAMMLIGFRLGQTLLRIETAILEWKSGTTTTNATTRKYV